MNLITRQLPGLGEIEARVAEFGRFVIEDVTLDDASFEAFATSLGPLIVPTPQNGDPNHPSLFPLTESSKTGTAWHTDYAFCRRPPRFSLLLCRCTPATGGDTEFIDTRRVYRELPPTFAAQLDGARGVFCFREVFARKLRARGLTLTAAQRRISAVVHPLVKHHPQTGEAALHLHQQYLVGIEGMSKASGRELLARVYDQTFRDAYIERHRWRVGDLVIWDNRSLLHRGPREVEGRRRLVRAVVI